MGHGRRVSVTGLGYVGLPVAVALARIGPVVAFDKDRGHIRELKDGIDRTGEVTAGDLAAADIRLVDDAEALEEADFHIVTVPTPVTADNRPDLTHLLAASRTLGARIKKGDIVVFESTVYPGVTEEECLPLLTEESGLEPGRDFQVGYSPERINPGDAEHRFETITKVIAAGDPATLEVMAAVYGSVVTAGLHRAPDIKTAEAAKVIENTQRDLNIALMNELALIFESLGLDTHDVLAAAGTKWNFLPFTPGLVGGHCIGVDPYYLTHRAEAAGYHPQVILAGRAINDGMGAQVARQAVQWLADNRPQGTYADAPTAVVLGLTFKEDVPDIRNTRAIDIVRGLEEAGIRVQVHDPLANGEQAKAELAVELTAWADLLPADAVVLAVAHKQYVDGGWPMISGLLTDGRGFVGDVGACLDRGTVPDGVSLWRL